MWSSQTVNIMPYAFSLANSLSTTHDASHLTATHLQQAAMADYEITKLQCKCDDHEQYSQS